MPARSRTGRRSRRDIDPCTELETRGGIWRYEANQTGQHFSTNERYATGIRNAVGIAIDASGQVYSTQHGRDQLAENWPKLYTPVQGQNFPSEVLLKIDQGSGLRLADLLLRLDAGEAGAGTGVRWRRRQGDRVVRHEAAAGRVLPGALGAGCPALLQLRPLSSGVSWRGVHRVPRIVEPGAGSAGRLQRRLRSIRRWKAQGQYEIFADGFAGATKEPGKAAHRPTGLAVGPDGALYISDDVRGRIWRVVLWWRLPFRRRSHPAAPAPASRCAESVGFTECGREGGGHHAGDGGAG